MVRQVTSTRAPPSGTKRSLRLMPLESRKSRGDSCASPQSFFRWLHFRIGDNDQHTYLAPARQFAAGQVSFTYKDYSQGGRVREMTLPAEEFIRRFLLHVLPERLVRIRYFGLLSNRHRQRNLARCRALLGEPKDEGSGASVQERWQSRLTRLTGRDPTLCPLCGKGHLRLVEELPAVPCVAPGRSPP